jgi:hypothetical protein
MSAPMIQTKLIFGKRRLSRRNVSTEYFVPSAASIDVAMTRRASPIAAAPASRSANGAMPMRGFNGLPGETINHT